MARAKSLGSTAQCTSTIGFEAKLWLTADKQRNNMDAAWYDQIVANKQQSRILAALRDTLLPKLLSGELSVNGLDVAVQ